MGASRRIPPVGCFRSGSMSRRLVEALWQEMPSRWTSLCEGELPSSSPHRPLPRSTRTTTQAASPPHPAVSCHSLSSFSSFSFFFLPSFSSSFFLLFSFLVPSLTLPLTGSRAGPVTCSQTLSTDVEAGALLAIVPHAVTCFADARYKQTQVVRMAKGANLVLVDWLTSGRMARGEQWAFDNYETSNDVLLDGQLLVHEAVIALLLSRPSRCMWSVFSVVHVHRAGSAQRARRCTQHCREDARLLCHGHGT